MKNQNKKIGVIVEVDGAISKIGVYSLSNDAEVIWNGQILAGPKVSAFLTINQNDIKIIATVSSEKIKDQQNSVKSVEFDNRFKKESINRIIEVKVKGVIEKNKFEVTSKYVPMVGNQVTLTTRNELNVIYGLDSEEATINIGNSLLENYPIQLSINSFFASHIGIFGNTGSGKSNTLHKVYLELFKSHYYNEIIKKSQFFVIDFNGEYCASGHFGISGKNKKIFEINTRKPEQGNKLPIEKKYIFDADILAILFDARPATQIPFLRSALKKYNEEITDASKFANLEIGLLTRMIKGTRNISSDSLDNWINACKNMGVNETLFEGIENILTRSSYGNIIVNSPNGISIVVDEQITEEGMKYLKIEELKTEVKRAFSELSTIKQLSAFLEFQRVYVTTWKSTNIEHINPLFKRIETSFTALEKVVEIKDRISGGYKALNIISLVHVNQEITRLVPMILSKMIYDEQKSKVAKLGLNSTIHLIIDEAHNILNAVTRHIGDDWQDYRLTVFEEIIKEGRKFGFYITLSSQRPSDISPTILSQVHNYFIHRLINERDLNMLENTMPTLDRNTYKMISSLGQGEAIITGNSIKVPVFVKVAKEEVNRPKSDDVILTELWCK